jgi:sporulation protein YlmC with PRC-barrel domain
MARRTPERQADEPWTPLVPILFRRGVMRISYDEDLKGRAVIDGTGRVVGHIDGLLVDGESWRVEAFRVRLRRDAAEQIGAEHRLLQAATLEIPIALVHAAGDAVILNVPASALRELNASGAASTH